MSNIENIESPFASSFPLPFRVILLGGLGILCWATNIHGLHLLGIDLVEALEINSHDLPLPRLSIGRRSLLDPHGLASSSYRLFYAYALWGLASWSAFRYCTSAGPELVDVYKFIPTVTGLAIILALASPFNVFERRERHKFLL